MARSMMVARFSPFAFFVALVAVGTSVPAHAQLANLKVTLSSGAAGGGAVMVDDTNDDGVAGNGIIELRNHNFPANQAEVEIVSVDVKAAAQNGFSGIVVTTPGGASFKSLVAAPSQVSLVVTGTLTVPGGFKGADASVDGSADPDPNNNNPQILKQFLWDGKADITNIRIGGAANGFAFFNNVGLAAKLNKAVRNPNQAGNGPMVALQGIMDIWFGGKDETVTLPSSAFVGVAPVGARQQKNGAGKKMKMMDKVPGPDSLVYLAKDPAITLPQGGGSDDPTMTGASFTVFNPATSEFATYELPATDGVTPRWRRNAAGTTYKFTNHDAPAGPSAVKTVVLHAGLLKVVAKGLEDYTLDEASQTDVVTILTTGTTDYCSSFATPIKDVGISGTTGGVFLSKDQPAPAMCESP